MDKKSESIIEDMKFKIQYYSGSQDSWVSLQGSFDTDYEAFSYLDEIENRFSEELKVICIITTKTIQEVWR